MTASDERMLETRLATVELPAGPGAAWLANTIRHDSLEQAVAATIAVAALPHVSLQMDSTAPQNAASDLSLTSILGEGGMGRIHLARQRSLERDVAVKTLKDGAPHQLALALLREARTTGALEHPGVVPVHALGVDSRGQPLLVMKRVEGADFSELLAAPDHPIWLGRQGKNVDRLTAKLEIVLQVSRTLDFAHARGVIHRDIKPANVMVGRFGEVYLLDWGIATKKGPAESFLVGTPGFMAPEMFLGGVVDERTDVYLLGAMLHNVLTGALRHADHDLRAAGESALASAAVVYGPDVPSQLADLCNRATRRAPDERPQSAEEFRDVILAFMQNRAALELSDAARERLSAFRELMVSAPPDAAPTNLTAAYRLITEARFGFAQCLRSYPTHEEANAGARESVTALVELELRQGHVDSADALLDELAVPDAALEKRVADVRANLMAQRSEAGRLEALGRDVDPSAGLVPRLAVVLGAAAISVVIAFMVHTNVADERNVWVSVAMVGIMMVLTGGVAFAIRGWAFKSAFNRRLGAFFFMALAFWLLDRTACALTGGAVETAMLVDLWVMAASLGAGAIAVERRLAISVVPFIAAALATRAWPERVSLWFSLAMLLGTGSFAIALIAQSRAAAKKA